ncbi:hypothetical protein VIGAN_01120400 [Vigna angularis var. angularis]|uniref:Uncharacterized protein n=2 Tax=Phaseolus angularis TaxID=3914 RepID=A0A0S3QZG5_PHAAN|nr:hypothetical protein VIGAN_01120400 [Vigna angularis var. angularis]
MSSFSIFFNHSPFLLPLPFFFQLIVFKHSKRTILLSGCVTAIDEYMNDEMPIGWPFGLGFLNTRLRDVESLPAAPVEPHSMHIPSTSFSSFSSSNLDTESTASFFQDNSVSLGHLIGLRAGEKGRLYFPNSVRIEEREEKTLAKCSTSDDGSKVKEEEMSGGICISILLEALFKISKSKKSSSN